uniref:Uncharacterized protein n=1 Tax=Anguilla anguilla TaxID=7936 RepID=A0A0E9R842_ANGAN
MQTLIYLFFILKLVVVISTTTSEVLNVQSSPHVQTGSPNGHIPMKSRVGRAAQFYSS